MFLIKQLLVLSLLHSTFAGNFQNNACYDIFSYHFLSVSNKCYENPDVLSNNLTSIASRHGYDTVIFSVTTGDGYVLKLYRISPSNTTSTQKVPVFVLHGIAVNVESWVDIGNRSLAFNLADRGYDVWLGTLRGTMNTNEHQTLTIDDAEYWNFNLDTLTKEDVNVQIELVSNITKQKVIIVGHSMGTTLSFMYAAEYPERANQLIRGIIALAPVVYLEDVPLLQLVMPWGFPLIQILKALNIKGLLYQEKFIHEFESQFCKILPEICYSLVSTASGTTKQFAPEDLLLFTSYWPSGLSVYLLEHFLQISRDRRFQKFNYCTNKNQEVYGTTQPPIYDLTKIQTPVFLFYGKHDVLYLEKNIDRLYNELGSNQKSKVSVPRGASEVYDYSHIDFIWSANLQTFLYKDLTEQMDLLIKN